MTLVINTYGPSIVTKLITQAAPVFSFLLDNNISYDQIYLKDTGGLGGADEGYDWVSENSALKTRKKVRLKQTDFNGLDLILDQPQISHQVEIIPTSFNFTINPNIYDQFNDFISLHPDLLALSSYYNSIFGLSNQQILGVHLRTTDINHWHCEDGTIKYDDIIKATYCELDRQYYDGIYLASDNIRDSIKFCAEFSSKYKVYSILDLTQDYIAPRSPDLVYYYDYVKKNLTYSNKDYWINTYLDFILLSLCKSQLIRQHSSCDIVIRTLFSLVKDVFRSNNRGVKLNIIKIEPKYCTCKNYSNLRTLSGKKLSC